MIWSTVFQFLLVGLVCGLLLLWLAQWAAHHLGALRGRARRLRRHRGLVCVEPVSVVYDARLDE
jgi:hypothetical protein